MQFGDIGNLTVAEVDALMAFLNDRRQKGYFCAVWRSAEEAAALIRGDLLSAQSMWSPVYGQLGEMASLVVEAAPIEGYRAWHGGMSLSRHLTGDALDMGYEYMNWWLSGWAGAVMARQGYYMSVLDRVREVLTPEEWAYWYEGSPAASDLPGLPAMWWCGQARGAPAGRIGSGRTASRCGTPRWTSTIMRRARGSASPRRSGVVRRDAALRQPALPAAAL